MNKLICLSFLASVALLPSSLYAMAPNATAPAAPPATAPNASSLPIIIVEQATLDKSQAVQDLAKQVEKKRDEIQKELATYEKELKKQDEELTKKQKELSEKEFTEKRQAFEKRVREIQEKIEIRRAQMEFAVEDAKKKVFEVFLKAAHKIRQDKGAQAIIYKETVVDADPNLDFSATVLAELNKELPTVKVNFPSEAEVKTRLQQQPAI